MDFVRTVQFDFRHNALVDSSREDIPAIIVSMFAYKIDPACR